MQNKRPPFMIAIRACLGTLCLILAGACNRAGPPALNPLKSAIAHTNWIAAITNKPPYALFPCVTNGSANVRLTVLAIPAADDAGLTEFLASTFPSDSVGEILQQNEIFKISQAGQALLSTNTPGISVGTAAPAAVFNILASATNSIVFTNSLRLGFGLEGVITKGEVIPIVTNPGNGADGKSQATIPVTLGHKVHLWTCQSSVTNYSVRATAVISSLIGFMPSKANVPQPAFHMNIFSIEAEFPKDRVLVLASKPHPTFQRYSSKVPYLSAIPAVGDLFSRSGVQTNWTRSLIFIEIRP
jgi:hypothetical protein